MAGVHGLEHIEGLATPDLAYNYTVRPHPKGVPHQVALSDLALALDVGRPRLKPHDMWLLQLQLGAVLDSDDALALGNGAGQGVKKSRLAAARPARYKHAELRTHATG